MKQLYTITFFLISMLGFADGMHIRGVISDIDTKLPIEGAFVQITFYQGFEFSAITDSLGQYDITTTAIVPDGNYGVEISAKNYYKPNGFIYVTKESFFSFSLKSKTPKSIAIKTDSIKIDTIKTTPVKLALDGFATNNLVFLIDISSSMNEPGKMPVLKESMNYLIDELRPTDRVSILTFSNNVKEVLPSTAVINKDEIKKTIDDLKFGSTTQGSSAIDKAYKTALKNFVQNGNNRIVLASDGVFTSGEKDYKKIQQTIQAGLDKNITMSIFCFGKNTDYVITKLKKLTSTGNGNFAVITSVDEGKQYMINEAKAVKETK